MKYKFFTILLALCAAPVAAQTINTVAGNGGGSFSGDGGAATSAEVTLPEQVAPIPGGGYYISQSAAVRKVDVNGFITTVAGTGIAGFTGDGGPATSAQLGRQVTGIRIGPDGSLYISDIFNNRVRKVTGGIISTFAGGGGGGDGGAATTASIIQPTSVDFDAGGNFYIAEFGDCRVRKVSNLGVISTIAGTASCISSGDGGQSTSASLSYPWGLRMDPSGNLLISEYGANRIRKINTAGIISTFAGTGGSGSTGDGGAAVSAQLNGPLNVDIDSNGNVYIAEIAGNRIRKVDGSGTITTIAGTGSPGFSGDGGPATSATFRFPRDAAVGYGKIYVSDSSNNRVREFAADVAPKNGTIVPATTCASEGYTGTKLSWCKNICEMNYTGPTLDVWIHRWVNRYRELPYCAVGK